MGDIIEFADMQLRYKRKQWSSDECKHKHIAYSPTDEEIICEDCNKVIQPFKAFMLLVDRYRDAYDSLQRRLDEIKELEARADKGLLIATKRINEAWRSRSMVPACPHCGEAILPEDGFGRTEINKEMVLQARRFAKK